MRKLFNQAMLRTISCDTQDPFSCWEVVKKLWPLSPWIMQKQYLTAALECPLSQSCPQRRRKIELCIRNPASMLARDKGCSHVLFAVTDQDALQHASYLRRSFALPFIWKQGISSPDTLPNRLQQMSGDIVKLFAPGQDWYLAWNFGDSQDACTFDFDLDYDSGWATLAASLLLTIEGGTPDHTIWASAAWDKNRGLQEVAGVAEKLESVYELGGRKLFVVYANKENATDESKRLAKQRQGQAVEIATFSFEPNPGRALQPYLVHFYYPPDNQQPLDIRCNYYNYLNTRQEGKSLTFDYYSKSLADALAIQCREQGICNLADGDLQKLENLVSFVSQNPTALLILSLIRPKRVLLFFTEETKKDLPKFQTIASAKNIALEPVQLNLEDREPDEDRVIHVAVRDFVARYGAQSTAIDVTPGTKNFSVIASWSVDPNVTPCLYIGHSWGKQAYAAGKERIRRLLPLAEK